MDEHEQYQSPFSWRYGSGEMRRLWSENNRRRLWRRIWLAIAEAQAGFGLVNDDQLADLRQRVGDVDVARAHEIERQIHHDLMAELQVYAAQCPVGGAVLHLGATSMDVKDNADILLLQAALDLILNRLGRLLALFGEHIERWADTAIIAFTHLQPAEPSTLGYRLAMYGQDLWLDWTALERVRAELRGKGFLGAVGTGASFAALLGSESLGEFEARMAASLDMGFFPVATQTYPRKQDYAVVSALASLGGSLYKFAFDLRLLQSPPIGELGEPFGEAQVGSSAMPFKRNPIQAEKIDSLARALAQMPRLAWDNAAHSLLERTLDDSANRRTMLPEAFLIADELLAAAQGILQGLRVDEIAIARNLEIYGPFAATEKVLMALGKAGADRQEMHGRLRGHVLAAWEAVQAGLPNPLEELVVADERFRDYLEPQQVRAAMQLQDYTGDAPARARRMARILEQTVQEMRG